MSMQLEQSVRSLVEFLLRTGDIDNRSGSGRSTQIMAEGARLHRRLQKAGGPYYHAEVPLACVHAFDADTSLLLEGRADGILTEPDEIPLIEEIKTSYRSLKKRKAPDAVHLAQAKCYAYMFLMQQDLPRIRVRMRYARLDTEEIKDFTEEYTREEITSFFGELMQAYEKWVFFVRDWTQTRTQSLRATEFPFSPREGQQELMEEVTQVIGSRRKLFLQAPTGSGKTMATLFPSLKAMGEGEAEKVFYLTAKTVTAQAAENALFLLREGDTRVKSVTLTAKEKICVLEKASCNPADCPRAKGHFDRVNDAMYDLLLHEDAFDRKTIEAYAEKHRVCPFEFALDMSLFADVIIGDYNYVFDPHVSLKRFFAEGVAGRKYVFLIDEAHNLLDRGREMFSAQISDAEVRAFYGKVKGLYPRLESRLKACNRDFTVLKRSLQEEMLPGDPWGEPASRPAAGSAGSDGTVRVLSAEDDDLINLAVHLQECYEAILRILHEEERRAEKRRGREEEEEEENVVWDLSGDLFTGEDGQTALFPQSAPAKRNHGKEADALRDELLDFLFLAGHFLLIWQNIREDYVVYAEDGKGREPFTLRLFCVSPARNLRNVMEKGRAAVLFSATFLPLPYYRALLGGDEADREAYARSVFDPEKQGLFLVRDVTTRYTRRTREEYARIAFGIREILQSREGNYLVFFPSYAFLEKVAAILSEEEEWAENSRMPRIRYLIQEPSMTEEKREAFLEAFREKRTDETEPQATLAGLCVMGGIFSEGIDLRGEHLIGVIVVGTGLPAVCTEREIMKAWFEQAGKDAAEEDLSPGFGDIKASGFDAAYKYPGMTKVLQAAGRLIRTEEDIGIVALFDDRFLQTGTRQLFPREWEHIQAVTTEEIGKKAALFWESWMVDYC